MIFPLPVAMADDWIVVPGTRLGTLRLSDRPKAIKAQFGLAPYGDAAMGKSWSTWMGRGGGRLDVYQAIQATGTPREKVRIEAVRATSSRFHLSNGLHPGSDARALKRSYPHGKRVSSYRSPSGLVNLWDDAARGLAWEVGPNERVLALIVHPKGHPLTSSLGPYVSSPLQKG